ncbi:MAG: hypothetical protein V4695_06960 [Pseudomonadota bacterium]
MKIGPSASEQFLGIDHHESTMPPPSPSNAAKGHRRATATPCATNPQLASLASLPNSVLGQITNKFVVGTKDASRLASVNRSLRQAVSPRSVADRLVAATHAPQPDVDRVIFFKEIIAEARGLTPDLRQLVLMCVQSVLQVNLHTPANRRFHEVFEALQVAMHEMPDVHQRYLLLYKLGLQLGDVTFRDHYYDRNNHAFSKTAMSTMFENFKAGFMDFVLQNVNALKRLPKYADARTPSPIVAIVVETLTMLARSLFLIKDSTHRNDTWHDMFNDQRAGTLADRKKLVATLSCAIGDLEEQVDRETAFAAIVQCLPSIPIVWQPTIVFDLAQRLQHLSEAACRSNFFALRQIVARMPPREEMESLTILLIAHGTRIESDWHSMMADAIRKVQALPEAESSATLCTLARMVVDCENDQRRMEYFDDIWQIAVELNPEQAVSPLIGLNAAIYTLHGSDQQHARFQQSLDFISENILPHVSEHGARQALLNLINATFSLHDTVLQLVSARDTLSLIALQPSSQQVRLLNHLYESLTYALPEISTSMLGAIFRVVGRLDPADQISVFRKATYTTLHMNESEVKDHLPRVVSMCDTLPENLRQAAWNEVIEGFEIMFNIFEHTAQSANAPVSNLRDTYCLLVRSTELLPLQARAAILRSAVDAIESLDPAIFSMARQEVNAHVGQLPASMQAAFLTPQTMDVA